MVLIAASLLRKVEFLRRSQPRVSLCIARELEVGTGTGSRVSSTINQARRFALFSSFAVSCAGFFLFNRSASARSRASARCVAGEIRVAMLQRAHHERISSPDSSRFTARSYLRKFRPLRNPITASTRRSLDRCSADSGEQGESARLCSRRNREEIGRRESFLNGATK